MLKSKREKKNPYLKIEGLTFDGFKRLDVKKIIPFFKQVQKNSKHYQEMPEGPKKEELFDLYTKMYYEYYETLLLQKDSVNPAEYLDLFDPHVIFGKVSPDYYENQPKPNKMTKQTPSGTYIKDDTTRLDLPRSGAQAYVPLPPKFLHDKLELKEYLPDMDEGGGGGATGGSKKKRKSKRKNKSKRKLRKKSRKLKKKRSKK